MGKIFKLVLGLTIGIPCLLVGVSAACIYGLFYENSTSPVARDVNFNNETMMSNAIHKSLENVSSRKALTFGLGEDDLNQLLIQASDSMNETAKKFVGAPYVKIDSENKTFDFFMHFNAPIFKTKVKISTTLDFKRLGNDPNHPEGIMFKINEIELGRTPIGGFILGVAKNFINDQSIEEIFKDAGFNIKCDLANKTLFYSAFDLKNDVNRANPDLNPFYLSMVDMAIENGFLGVSYNKDLFGLDIKLDMLLSNVLVDEQRSKDLIRDDLILGYLDSVQTLLNKNIIPGDKVDLMLDYLCDGYNYSSTEIKNYVDTLSLSEIGINDVKLHEGLKNHSKNNLNDAFINNLNISDLSKASVCIDETAFNDTLLSSKIIGECYPIVFKGNSWHVNAIFIDDFYVNILDNALNFILSINLNGISTKVVIPLKVLNTQGSKLIFEIKDIQYGQLKASEGIRKECVKYVMEAISNLNTWFKKENDNQISLDFANCITSINNEALQEKLKNATLDCSISGVNQDDIGSLNLTFKYKNLA